MPKRVSDRERIDLDVGPKCPLIALAMELLLVIATKRHGELIADLSAGRFGLGKLQMMRIARWSLADQARLGSDKQEVGSAGLIFYFDDGLIEAVQYLYKMRRR